MKRNRILPLTLPSGGRADIDGDARERVRGGVSTFERMLARGVIEALGGSPIGLELWNGEEIAIGAERPAVRAQLRDRGALYQLVRNLELHFGDLYSLGRIEVEGSLVAFLEAAYRGVTLHMQQSQFARLRERLTNRRRANTLLSARDNIAHHYDLGNDFYRLWLDNAAMQYTCAYFPDPAMTLEAAQIAKLDHTCRKLRLKPGEHVVEAGCGWGGLALHMARHYGVTVRAYNISREQVAWARERAKGEGLSDRVEYVLDDYRNAQGPCDAFVSIGMLEHVGPEHYAELGATINRCLAPNGRGLIHSIGRHRPARMNIWIERRIFPGAYPPSLKEMMDIFEPHDFSVLDVENLRLHYAKTLEHWLARYEMHAPTVERMFDPFFVRAWRLYLAGSIAAFTTGSLQIFQVLFTRPTVNDLPWSRAHLYR